MTTNKGLATIKAKELQLRYGKNQITPSRKGLLRKRIKHILMEPIYDLLSLSALIYFLLGEPIDGAIMILFVLFVIGIDVLQDIRTGKTLRKLKELSSPKVTILRDGKPQLISSVDIVPGDVMLISEGVKIPADGYILSASGLSIDESILTGESEAVWKRVWDQKPVEIGSGYRRDYCYTGTLVTLGNGRVLVDKIGNQTEYGKLADHLTIETFEESPLQKEMSKLAKQCSYIAAILFILVSIATYLNLGQYDIRSRIITSILAGTVLALSMVPGEFPVIQSVFLSMGALRLTKQNGLIRRLSAVETLGAVSVLCLDKTGTITKNKMIVENFWSFTPQEEDLCRAMLLSCKEDTYDPMEKAMLEYCNLNHCNVTGQLKICSNHTKPKLLKEYTFTHELKAMGHAWRLQDKSILIAAKGCPETIISLCDNLDDKLKLVYEKVHEMSKEGLRVIAVAEKKIKYNKVPQTLTDCRFHFCGLIGLFDPPKEHMKENISKCYQAGIRVMMITGDHPLTACSIAKMIGIKDNHKVVTGEDIEVLSEERLREEVKSCNIFARVMPSHKMRIVKALKKNGDIVAMSGDGVNDSPALKAADIGIAMGNHGSEVSREASDLVLLDDNFATILASVKDGRRIYQNIKKSIGYIFAIHIPIALISFVSPLIGITPEALLLLPLHIVILELVMDPTCSIALERQPAEKDIMNTPPRSRKEHLLTKRLFLKSFLQGIVIFFASFFLYYVLCLYYPLEIARTAGFSVLVLSNIFLVLVNCSSCDSMIYTIKMMCRDKGFWFVNIFTFLGLGLMVFSPLCYLIGFCPLPLPLFLLILVISAISVLWYEFFKYLLRKNRKCY